MICFSLLSIVLLVFTFFIAAAAFETFKPVQPIEEIILIFVAVILECAFVQGFKSLNQCLNGVCSLAVVEIKY